MSIKINKNGKEYDLGFVPKHYPADRVYLDGDITKTVQDEIDEVAENINNLITTDTFTATLTVGDNLLRFNGSATSKVTSGNMPTNNKFIVVPVNMVTSNSAMLSVHIDGGYADIHCNTDMAQTVGFRWYQFNI